jgi:hypothetical protein
MANMNKIMSQFLIIAVLLLISTPSKANEPQSCLPVQEIKINTLFPNQPAEKLNKLPKPTKTSYGFGEDDGGIYKGTTFEYPGYKVEIVRGVIDSITLMSPEYKWYKDIKIGMSRDRVRELLGSSLVADGHNQDQYITCESTADVYAILEFVDNKLTKITLIADRP